MGFFSLALDSQFIRKFLQVSNLVFQKTLGLSCALITVLSVLARQQHEVILQNDQRAGFLIGDGAGVGKGRTIAGIILENYLKGRKRALWYDIYFHRSKIPFQRE